MIKPAITPFKENIHYLLHYSDSEFPSKELIIFKQGKAFSLTRNIELEESCLRYVEKIDEVTITEEDKLISDYLPLTNGSNYIVYYNTDKEEEKADIIHVDNIYLPDILIYSLVTGDEIDPKLHNLKHLILIK